MTFAPLAKMRVTISLLSGSPGTIGDAPGARRPDRFVANVETHAGLARVRCRDRGSGNTYPT